MVIVGRHSDRTRRAAVARARRRRSSCALALVAHAASDPASSGRSCTLSLAMLGLASMFGPFWALATSTHARRGRGGRHRARQLGRQHRRVRRTVPARRDQRRDAQLRGRACGDRRDARRRRRAGPVGTRWRMTPAVPARHAGGPVRRPKHAFRRKLARGGSRARGRICRRHGDSRCDPSAEDRSARSSRWTTCRSRSKRGQLVGLLGPNGAGKTTTVSMIAGLVTPERGEVLDRRRAARAATPIRRSGASASCRRISRSTTSCRARDNLRFFGALYSLSGAALDTAIDVGARARRPGRPRARSR